MVDSLYGRYGITVEESEPIATSVSIYDRYGIGDPETTPATEVKPEEPPKPTFPKTSFWDKFKYRAQEFWPVKAARQLGDESGVHDAIQEKADSGDPAFKMIAPFMQKTKESYDTKELGRQELAQKVESEMSALPWYSPTRATMEVAGFGLDLSAFGVAAKPAAALAAAGKKAFTVPFVQQRIGTLTEKMTPYIPDFVETMIHRIGIGVGGGAVLAAAEPGSTLKSILKGGEETADFLITMEGAGRLSSLVNPLKGRFSRHIFPFAAESATFGVYPSIKEGKALDPANFLSGFLLTGFLRGSRISRKSIKDVVDAEIGDYLGSGETTLAPTLKKGISAEEIGGMLFKEKPPRKPFWMSDAEHAERKSSWAEEKSLRELVEEKRPNASLREIHEEVLRKSGEKGPPETLDEFVKGYVNEGVAERASKIKVGEFGILGDFMGPEFLKKHPEIADIPIHYREKIIHVDPFTKERKELKGHFIITDKAKVEQFGAPEAYIALSSKADWKTIVDEGRHGIQWKRGRFDTPVTHKKVQTEADIAVGAIERLYKNKVRKWDEVKNDQNDLEKLFNNFRKDPKNIALLEGLTPEGFNKFSDRLWYRVVKNFVGEQEARIIGVKRGVLPPPKPLHEYYYGNISNTFDAMKSVMEPKEFHEIQGKLLGDKKMKDVKDGNVDIAKLEEVQARALKYALDNNVFRPQMDVQNDPYKKHVQVYYHPKDAKRRQRLTLQPPEESIRLSLQIDPQWTLPRLPSPRYFLDGLNIAPDVEHSMHKFSARLEETFNKIAEAYKSGPIDGKRVLEYIRSGEDQRAVPNVTTAEIKMAKVARESYDHWVKDPQISEAMKLTTAEGKVRKRTDYMTAIHEYMKNKIGEKPILFEGVPKETMTPMAKGRLNETLERADVPRALMTYEYLAGRTVYLEPAIERTRERVKWLAKDGVRRKAAISYIKDVMNLQKQLYPSKIESVSKAITSRFYSGLIGLSPATPLKNLTQYLNTVVEIGTKYGEIGVRKWLTDPIAKKRAEEAKVAEQFRPEYMEELRPFVPLEGTMKPLERPYNKFRNIETWMRDKSMYMFMKTEKFLREASYIGAREQMLAEKKRVNLKGFRKDIVENINMKLKEGDIEGAADAYGREVSIKTQYGYTKLQGSPFLKTAHGRLFAQFYSYPHYTMENWYRTAVNGNPKKALAMMGVHPLILMAGRPAGVWLGGFVALGMLPHLSPFLQFANSLANYISSHHKNDLEGIERWRNELAKSAWSAAPGGRMISTRILKFAETLGTRDKDGTLWTLNDYTGKREKTNLKNEVKKLMDWLPYEKAQDIKYRRKMATFDSNFNYMIGEAYMSLRDSFFYKRLGDTAKQKENWDKAMETFKYLKYKPKSGVVKRWLMLEQKPALIERILRDRRMAMRFSDSLPADERDDFFSVVYYNKMNQ